MKTVEEINEFIDVIRENIAGDVLSGKINSFNLGTYRGWWEALEWVLEDSEDDTTTNK